MITIEKEWLQLNGLYKCPYCKIEKCKKGIATHIWRKHENGQEHTTGRKGHIPWNKGLTKENNNSVAKTGRVLSERIKNGELTPSFLGKKHSEKAKEKIALNGGYRQGSGRGKSGWYKGYWCDSSWELAWVIYNLENGIKFSRNNEGFEYEYNGKQYKYFPDFKIGNFYYEIKGFLTEKDKFKFENFPFELEIIDKNKIEMFIHYTIDKYGNDYIKLYDKYNEKKTEKQIKKEIERSEKKIKSEVITQKRKEIILNSNINFLKFGWVNDISKLTGIRTQKVGYWMKKNLPDIYEIAFKRR